MTETRDFTGDVTLTGQEDPPIKVSGTEDVFVEHGAVDGDLEIRDAEYVYTHAPVTGDADVPEPATHITGALEDTYAEPDGADGDVIIEHAEDVFIEAGAVAGEITARGVENIFDAPEVTTPGLTPSEYDVNVTGWKQRTIYEHPVTGVYLTGAKHTVEVDRIDTDIDVYVTGWDHNVKLNGDGGTVTLHLLGRDNTISVGAYVDVEVASDPGMRNTVDEEPIPTEDLIETARSEAFPMFGRSKVTYQTSANGHDTCPNCGADADAVIARHHMDAFFLFGTPVRVHEQSSNPPKECENCADHLDVAEAQL